MTSDLFYTSAAKQRGGQNQTRQITHCPQLVELDFASSDSSSNDHCRPLNGEIRNNGLTNTVKQLITINVY